MNLWPFIKQTPKLLTPYVQITHSYSAIFNQLPLLFHRCGQNVSSFGASLTSKLSTGF